MALLGKVVPLLSALIAGWSHFLIFPAKMPARVSPESLRSVTPERLYSTAIPPAIHGMVTGSPTFVASSAFSATSEPAKSTVLAVSCWIPAPHPTPWQLILTFHAAVLYFFNHSAMMFLTKGGPA